MRLEFLAPIITCLFIWLIYLTHIKNKKWLKLVFIGLTSITIVYTIIEINKKQKEIDNTWPIVSVLALRPKSIPLDFTIRTVHSQVLDPVDDELTFSFGQYRSLKNCKPVAIIQAHALNNRTRQLL